MKKTLWILLTFLLIQQATISAWAQNEANLVRIQESTVFIYQSIDTGDNFQIACVGTGTLVSPNGHILTNAHNITPSAACPGETLIIALSIQLDKPPIPIYQADIAQVNEQLDIGLIQIARSIDGRRVVQSDLNLPFVELGDSSNTELDQTIIMAGYPDLEESPVTTVRGTISAFIAETNGGDRAWIKTSASVPGLMSGGGAYNQAGQLIGIPTTAPSNSTESRNCQYIQDTNGDSLVNDSDRCVSIGSVINAIRPVNFAKPLLRAATLDLNIINNATIPNTANNTATEPEIGRLFFALSVNESNMPTTIVSSVPTGTNSLYLFFDYRNMTPDTVYELRVNNNNIPNPTFSLAPVRWSGGTNGLWYIGSRDIPWPNGVYDFTIFVDGIAKSTASIIVGGAPVNTPSISDITFGLSDLDGTPLGNGFVLPTGTTASARFIYRNMSNNIEWVARWFYEGGEVFRTPASQWVDGENGAKTITIQDPNGLIAGNYRLEIYIDNRLAATSDFTIAGQPTGVFPEVFTNLHFASAPTQEEAITAPASNNFNIEIDNLHVLFDWQQVAIGSNWTIQWLVDNEVFFQQQARWGAPLNGENFILTLTRPGGILDGTYRVNLLIGSVQLANVEAVVGIGQLPIDTNTQVNGLQLQGQFIDIDTGQGIEGVTFVLISEDFSVADFVWDINQIHALGTSDQNGFFQMNRLLDISTDDLSVPYSVMIRAEGYQTIQADGFVVDEETENPLNLTIYMKRQTP